ncbi:sigma-70 family RNA polymerase sigma factor [candidate division WOR-3 bacterium]|uniref:Sigma-70 family RNA polymerase sigma factor n=1 Tax=candidate division WOR-3 bacterium TaxID=2052148 RepID=A0A9D5KAB0_UNCW3|nr:sigma-70 family RNA polymerase sigma factor [candidate division WOR-3 bacterium]MBD3364465.1 sigma-70 family RNA polymerase sigma factor [candidate division WOR-3 bacterium]
MKKVKKTPKSRKDANLSVPSNVKKGEMTSDGISATLTGIASGTDALDGARAREKALEKIYENHVPMVYNLCYRMLGNRADAQDATQDAFVKVYRNLDKFRGRAKLSTWIYRITMNHCIDRLRRKRLKTVQISEMQASPKRSHDTRIALEKAISDLSPSYRSVFILHDVQGFRHAEIAEILNITPGSSKSLLHRSRSILRKKLEGLRR